MPKPSKKQQGERETPPPPMTPARTRERRHQQLIVQAEALVEERLRDGSASPTEVVAILKLGTEYERANIARIEAQTEYLRAQRAKAEAETLNEKMFKEAIDAMSLYSGEGE